MCMIDKKKKCEEVKGKHILYTRSISWLLTCQIFYFLTANEENMFCFRREKKTKSTLASWKLPTLLQGQTQHVRLIKRLFSFLKKWQYWNYVETDLKCSTHHLPYNNILLSEKMSSIIRFYLLMYAPSRMNRKKNCKGIYIQKNNMTTGKKPSWIGE
jgi:hypothetical protein